VKIEINRHDLLFGIALISAGLRTQAALAIAATGVIVDQVRNQWDCSGHYSNYR
jgi:hypothetical protein